MNCNQRQCMLLHILGLVPPIPIYGILFLLPQRNLDYLIDILCLGNFRLYEFWFSKLELKTLFPSFTCSRSTSMWFRHCQSNASAYLYLKENHLKKEMLEAVLASVHATISMASGGRWSAAADDSDGRVVQMLMCCLFLVL